MAETNISQEQQDEALLQKFGYKQELRRTLGFISNFAVAFSYISVSTGTFSLFALGIVAGGPAFFWTWPIVAIGQFIVALNFAELASHFPIAGSIYQWSKRLSGYSLGWFTGWFYFFAGVLTITGVAITIPIPLIAIFPGIPPTILGMPNNVFIALVAIIVGTLINVAGVRLVSFINNIGVAAEIIGMIGFALVLLIFFNHQSLGFLFTQSTVTSQSLGADWTPGFGSTYFGAFAAAMFMSLFVIYGFDTAGTLGEETKDPQKNAPRGVLWAIGLSAIAGVLFLGGTILSIKDPGFIENIAAGGNKNIAPTGALPTIIQQALGTVWGNIYLTVVLVAVCVCTLAIQSATIRLMFSMGRDGRLPVGKVWGTVNPTFRTPLYAGIGVAILSAIPLLALINLPNSIGIIVVAATGLIYFSYFLNNIASLIARFHGWPRVKSPFSLGSWGVLVNVLALIYGGVMLVNFLWFGGLRDTFATNPSLNTVFGGNIGSNFFGTFPLFELSLIVLFVVGSIYWFGYKRRQVIASGERRAEALAD
ncbi:MAG TPA: amino acid permease [Ktedonobacteraceae bacterium]|nr:amino acid permease [Ktedonobacteraceae bacterium]